MATVPYGEGVPTVAPDVRSPDDYQHVQTTPNAFGAAQARGLEQFGAGAVKTGQFFGEVAADDATNNYQDAASKLLHGDPNKTIIGPDGQPQQDLGYLGLKGDAALRARPALEKQLDELMQQTRSGLVTPDQQLRFDNYSRRYRNYISGQIGTHADNQANAWYGEVNKASGELAIGHIITNADNDEEVKHGTADLIRARVKQAQLMGGGPELVQEAFASAKRDAIKAQVDAIAPSDPVRAQAVLDAHKEEAGAYYHALTAQLRSQVLQSKSVTNAQQALTKSGMDMTNPPLIQDGVMPISDAILQQESGNRSNAPVSSAGAIGPGQIKPATFAQYAHPGEDINNPNDNRAVANRMIQDYNQRYQGDPARVATAYFSGPGNVAPPGSPTPWINDLKDTNGKSVSSYVQDVTARVNPATAFKSNVYQTVHDMSGGDPVLEQHTLAIVNQQIRDAEIVAQQNTAARKQASENNARGYIAKAAQAKTGADVQALLQAASVDPNLDYETQKSIPGVIRQYVNDNARKNYDYGPGYNDALHRITLPEGSPNRISSYSQLLSMTDPAQNNGEPQLYTAGLKDLASMLKPENSDAATLKNLFFDSMKEQIESDTLGKKLNLPSNKTRWADYMRFAVPAIQKGLDEGKSMAELTDPKGPIAKAAVNFIRTPKQVMEELKANAEKAAADAAEAGKVNAPARTTDDILKDIHDKKLSAEEGFNEAKRLGLIPNDMPFSAPPAAPAPMAPLQ